MTGRIWGKKGHREFAQSNLVFEAGLCDRSARLAPTGQNNDLEQRRRRWDGILVPHQRIRLGRMRTTAFGRDQEQRVSTIDKGIGAFSRDRRVLGAILLVGLLYRCYAMTGDMLFDPVVYAQNAYNLLQGTFTLETNSWFAHRLTVFLPVAPLYAAFGVHPWTSKLWPLMCSMVQLLLGAAVAYRLFDRTTARVAIAVAALAPMDVVYATVLNPDIVISTFMTAAVVCWVLAYDRSRAHAGLLFASGLSSALAVVTRPFGVVLLLFYLLWIAWKRPPLPELMKGVAWGAAGAAVVLAPLALAYVWQTGDVLYRLGVESGRYGEEAKSEGGRWLYYPRLLLHPRFTVTGLAPHLFLLGLFGSILRPTRSRLLVLAWGLPILLYLQFGSMSASEYIPILKRERFLLPLTIPLSILAGSVSVSLSQFLGRRRRHGPTALLWLGLLAFAASSLLVVRKERALGESSYRAFTEVVSRLESDPSRPVLFDHWRTGYRFSYYFGFDEGADFYRGGADSDRVGRPGSFGESRLGYLAWYDDPASLPASYVVLDDEVREQVQAGDSITGTYRKGDVPRYADPPPGDWISIGRFGTFRVYRVDR